jgi:hypothetical protein
MKKVQHNEELKWLIKNIISHNDWLWLENHDANWKGLSTWQSYVTSDGL